jgi:hypothetical protein
MRSTATRGVRTRKDQHANTATRELWPACALPGPAIPAESAKQGAVEPACTVSRFAPQVAKLGSLASRAASPAFVFVRVFAATRLAWLHVSDFSSAGDHSDARSGRCFVQDRAGRMAGISRFPVRGSARAASALLQFDEAVGKRGEARGVAFGGGPLLFFGAGRATARTAGCPATHQIRAVRCGRLEPSRLGVRSGATQTTPGVVVGRAGSRAIR